MLLLILLLQWCFVVMRGGGSVHHVRPGHSVQPCRGDKLLLRGSEEVRGRQVLLHRGTGQLLRLHKHPVLMQLLLLN